MLGILNINKPAECTSRDVVNRVLRLVRPVKVGHAGTLDPMASGVLVVCLGPATRLIEYVQQMPKRYRATFLLGCTSPSDDTDTDVTELPDAVRPTRQAIEQALPNFVGSIEQVPPAYSAVKVSGRRAYQLARQGKEVSLQPRTVLVHALEVAGYAFPELRLDIECGSGTYVRSLGRDLARSLGTGTVMSGLVRTAIGPFKLEDALPLESVESPDWQESLRPAISAVEHLPRRQLTSDQVEDLSFGRLLSCEGQAVHGEIAGVDERGNLVAILRPGQGQLIPHRNFASSVRSAGGK